MLAKCMENEPFSRFSIFSLGQNSDAATIGWIEDRVFHLGNDTERTVDRNRLGSCHGAASPLAAQSAALPNR